MLGSYIQRGSSCGSGQIMPGLSQPSAPGLFLQPSPGFTRLFVMVTRVTITYSPTRYLKLVI